MSKLNWQQPYVNIFKHFTIASDKNATKHGDISSAIDSQLKSTVYKIIGANTNFINMPKLSGQSLNLTGRYIYFLFKPVASKHFAIHVDITTTEKVVIRISYSNQYKEFKATSNWLQFPFLITQACKETQIVFKEQTKWSILCIDLISTISSYTNRTYSSVRGFKLCANMLIKNVITSDFIYEPGFNYAEARLRNRIAFPRELAYPCEKYENWNLIYDYVFYPSDSINEPKIQHAQVKDVYSHPETAMENLCISKKKINRSIVTSLPMVGVEKEEKEINFVAPDEFDKQNQQDIHVYPFQSGHDLISSLSSSTSSLSNQDPLETEVYNQDDFKFKSTLEPDPILRLNKIIGFGSRNISTLTQTASNSQNTYVNCLNWSVDSQYLIYACQAIVVAYHINTANQYCFVGHADRVSCLSLSPDNSLLASGQAGQYSLVRVWDFQSRKCLSIFRNHDHSLYLLEFSNCSNYLCGVGKDKQGKSMLALWDIRSVKKTGNLVKLIAKAHTDVYINRLIFIPHDSTRLISCGKDNVRFWRLKNDTLRSCAVNLAPYVQSNDQDSRQSIEFTDISMNSRLGNNENLVYACTRTGQIFVFNIARMEIENVRILEPILKKKTGILVNHTVSPALRLNSLTISDKFCVTGSEDGVVRIWPLDFGQVSVEAEHEACIGVVRFSPDCSRIASATLNGNLGILDVNQKDYITLIRSHTDSILDISFDSSFKYLATCSLDFTVRVWSVENCKQMYDFSAPNEKPSRVCFVPEQKPIFACGFNSGKIRIFNVTEAKLLNEIKCPHVNSTEITDLKYSNDGKRLISGDSMRYLCLYDSERDYQLLRVLPNSLGSFGSLTISQDSKSLAIIGPTDSLISVLDSYSLNEILRINLSDLEDLDERRFTRLCYAPSGVDELICVTGSNTLLKFNSKNGRLLSSMPKIHRSQVDCFNASSDARFLVTSGDNAVKIWDYEMRLEKNFQTFIGHSSSVNRILLTPDNKTLITVGDSIVFWDFLAYFPVEDKNITREMSQGREKPIQTYNIIREKSKKNSNSKCKEKSFLNPNIDDYNQIKILNEESFCELAKQTWSNVSFERPRTPPVAADMYIETITANSDIDDELSINDETNLGESNNKPVKQFTNLPVFVQQETEDLINFLKPSNLKHLNARKKDSICARKKYSAPENKCGIRLNSIIGFNGKHAAQNLIWNPDRDFFAFSLGSIICIEDLKTGNQKVLHSHYEDITCLALRHDFNQIASASSYLLNITSESVDLNVPKCQIIIWDCVKFEKVASLFHKNASNVTCMEYSTDDRFLISVSDYMCPSLILWSSFDYSCLVAIESLNYVINDLTWNRFKCNEFVMAGVNKTLVVCNLEEKGLKKAQISFKELEIPLTICEQQNENFDFTSLTYGDNYLLFAATNYGLVTVWNTKTITCLLNWKADTNEIDVLVSVKHKLITGSSKGNLKLWNISSITDLKDKKDRIDSLIIENEITLNGAIKCCKFDPGLDIGILGTNKGTLWYVNWQEESSVRLVSTHSAKINSILCIDDKYLSTVSDDGSLNIWSLSDRERIVQFEVKIQALCQSLVYCDNKQFNSIAKYPKNSTNKNPLILVGYADGSIRLYDIDKKNIINKMKPLNHSITAIKYCENTHMALCGSIEGVLVVLDLNQGVATRILNDHKGAPITNIDSFYREDKKQTCWLASSRDRRVSVWSSKWSEDLFQMIDWLSFPAPPFGDEENKDNQSISYKYWLKYPPSLAYFEPRSKSNSTTETLVYVGYGLNKQILFYNFVKKQIIRNMDLSEWAECLAISPKLNLIAFGTKSRLLQIKDYNLATFQDYSQHSDTVSCMCFSNDAKKLFSTSFNEIFIWDVTI